MRIFMPFSASGGRMHRRLWVIQAAATTSAVILAIFVHSPLLLGVAVAAVLAAFYFVLSRLLAPLEAIRGQMRDICRRTAEDEALLHAQEDIDKNISLLRERLFADGDPTREGD